MSGGRPFSVVVAPSAAFALLAFSIFSPAPAIGEIKPLPPPPPPPTGPHHYNPGSRTVHTTYTCTDGYRSITLHYGQVPKGEATSLSRNGLLMSLPTVAKLNEILARFDLVSDVYPQCGTETDLMYVTGVIGQRHVAVEILWAPNHVELTRDDVR